MGGSENVLVKLSEAATPNVLQTGMPGNMGLRKKIFLTLK